MAAFDTPWMSSMSSPRNPQDAVRSQTVGDPSTIAAFAPTSTTNLPSSGKQRFTILIHQKSPLLVATPPQVTKALAYSHPFLLPLSKFAGLLSWTTGDPWESFLLLASFWAVTLYGDILIRWAGPIALVGLLIVGMYARRFSPLSSTGWMSEIESSKTSKGYQRKEPANKARHHKSLDEILDTLKLFTSRCNILLDPFFSLTDFLSTQRTATSATTRPALTSLFMRILLLTPVWYLLTLPPLRLITTKRVVLTFGTLALSWHSGPARVSRIILWRSYFIRRVFSTLTGLSLLASPSPSISTEKPPPLPLRTTRNNNDVATVGASSRPSDKPTSAGVRFTFVLYENQRRWLGIGWTSSMLAYERTSWTDEQLNPAESKDAFELPEADGGVARWRWVEGSAWVLEGAGNDMNDTAIDTTVSYKSGKEKVSTGAVVGDGGWIYYDNKWRDGRPGADGWSRYTRRRKWYRDAELVEITPSLDTTRAATPTPSDRTTLVDDGGHVDSNTTPSFSPERTSPSNQNVRINDTTILAANKPASSSSSRTGWFGKHKSTRSGDESSIGSGSGSFSLALDRDAEDEDDGYIPMRYRGRQSGVEGEWGVGEDLGMALG